MARADTITKLPLDEWARLVGIQPLHFNQVIIGTPTVCGQPWLQHPWQDVDRVGREDVAIAIAQAEADIERYLGYRLKPTWEVDEWQSTMRPWKAEFVNLTSMDVRGFEQVVFMDKKHVITGGIEAKEVVEAGAAIVYSDADGDGYDETATITATVDFTDECEVALYFPGHAGADEWEIRPITATIDNATATATIVVRRELLVDPDLWEPLTGAVALDGTVDGNFLTTVDVYRHYNDPQQQITFLWEPLAGTLCAACNGVGCARCEYSAQTGCMMIRGKPELGVFSYKPAEWNATTLEFDNVAWAVARQPDLVRVWYYAGLRDKSLTCPRQTMSDEWKRIVAYYASALLDRPMCECNNVHAWIEYWREDLAKSSAETEGFRSTSPQDLNNPFGTRRGAVFAWKRARQESRIPDAVFA